MMEHWPQDTEDKFYLSREVSFAELQEIIQEKWPDAQPENISIHSEYLHVDCLNHDQYDSVDWQEFVVVERNLVE